MPQNPELQDPGMQVPQLGRRDIVNFAFLNRLMPGRGGRRVSGASGENPADFWHNAEQFERMKAGLQEEYAKAEKAREIQGNDAMTANLGERIIQMGNAMSGIETPGERTLEQQMTGQGNIRPLAPGAERPQSYAGKDASGTALSATYAKGHAGGPVVPGGGGGGGGGDEPEPGTPASWLDTAQVPYLRQQGGDRAGTRVTMRKLSASQRRKAEAGWDSHLEEYKRRVGEDEFNADVEGHTAKAQQAFLHSTFGLGGASAGDLSRAQHRRLKDWIPGGGGGFDAWKSGGQTGGGSDDDGGAGGSTPPAGDSTPPAGGSTPPAGGPTAQADTTNLGTPPEVQPNRRGARRQPGGTSGNLPGQQFNQEDSSTPTPGTGSVGGSDGESQA